jgi:transcriptional regulator with XRE-family HTH domain
MTAYRTLTSTAHSRELGGELRRAREATGATAFDFARKLGWHQSRISRIETGKLDPSEVEVAIYLTNCGVSGDELNRVLDLATESCDGFWYRKHDQQLPEELRSLMVQENTAAAITDFELTRIPGLLQEEHYGICQVE